MTVELDFTNLPINHLKMYGGANGNKIGVLYQGEHYMLKFPPKPTRNQEMSYANSCISEYLACHIFQTLGIPTQEALLVRYQDKIAVACKDFEVDGFVLKEFAHLKNTMIDSAQNGYGTDLQDVLDTIHGQQIVSPEELEAFFWNMFVGDALLGNFDRHNGNWGFLVNSALGDVKIAPVFDCGSCLYPQLEEARMDVVLSNSKELEERIFVYPTSALQQNGKKINYAQFLLTTEHPDCLAALERIGSRIDLPSMEAIIHEAPFISPLQKRFYSTMLAERTRQIISPALERVHERSLTETGPIRQQELLLQDAVIPDIEPEMTLE